MIIKYDGCILNWEIIGRELMMAEEGHFQWQVICYGDVTQKYDLDKWKKQKVLFWTLKVPWQLLALYFFPALCVASWDNELEEIQQKQFYASILPMTHLVWWHLPRKGLRVRGGVWVVA